MLRQDLEEIQNQLRGGHFPNEASVSQGVVLRVLSDLGWPVFNPLVVCPEYAFEGGRVDFALCHPAGKPRVLIEVKQVGQSEGAARQLFQYAFHGTARLVILTDGREWNFFLPAEEGSYEERRVYKLDIMERPIEESTHRFERYLKYDAVCSGEALASARDDYKDVARNRQIRETLPIAWKKLVDDEDGQLLDLLADSVENLCGYKPDPDTVARFLKTSVLQSLSAPAPSSPAGPRLPTPASGRATQPLPPSSPLVGFTLLGQTKTCRNALDVLVTVVEELANRDPAFLDRFLSLPKHGRTRRYVARDPSELYPGRPDLAEEYSHQLRSGYWLGTNVSRHQIERILKTACEVARLRYRSDLTVRLGS